MKRKEILVLLGEVLGSRAVYSVASLVITITMLSGITIILRNDIRDIKNYVQSVVDGDPNYKEIHSQVRGSENVVRGNIDLETLLAKEDKKTETTSTANNISSGYDNYTPTQTITDDYNNKPSNGLNNSNSGETTIANNSNSNNSNNNSTNEVNNSNNNSDKDKKEEVLDRSSFNGKDIMISEGEPFNPMNGLQLAATDINGKNITNKIVIKENNVDTYKPGLYTVKAAVELSNKSNLEKEFFVRVEPTVLNLAVNDVRTSKDILEKSEKFNLSFSIKSSKSYLEVASVNINDKDYDVKKTSSSSFLRKSDKYEVDLVAPYKCGVEKIQIKSVTMSDGTVVDVDKSIEVEVLKEDAYLSDVVIEDKSSTNNEVRISFNLNDIDNTIRNTRVCIYNEKNEIVAEEYVLKDNKSSSTKFSSMIKLDKDGNYVVKVIANRNVEGSELESNILNEIELLSENISINLKSIGSNENKDSESLPMGVNDEEFEVYSENARNLNKDVDISSSKSKEHQVFITGNIADSNGNIKPGTVQIEIPTSISFTVDKEGDFIAPVIKIKNNGQEKVEVYVYKFIDSNGSAGIDIKSEENIIEDIDNTARNKISLGIRGSEATAYFKTESIASNECGIYRDANLNEKATGGIKVLEVYRESSDNLYLEGKAGKQELEGDAAIRDNFTLILKFKKAEKN